MISADLIMFTSIQLPLFFSPLHECNSREIQIVLDKGVAEGLLAAVNESRMGWSSLQPGGVPG
jgi:hypothetical protein